MFNIIFIDRFVKLKCSLNTNTEKLFDTLFIFPTGIAKIEKFSRVYIVQRGTATFSIFFCFCPGSRGITSLTRLQSLITLFYFHQDILPILLLYFAGPWVRTPSTVTAACDGSQSGSRLTILSPGSPSAPPPPS